MLGENTANVDLLESTADSAPTLVSTVWVKLGERWYEHGYQRQVVSTRDVVVWYPSTVTEESARQVAANAAEALAQAERLGWSLLRPVTIAFAGPEEKDRMQLLPGYVAKGPRYGPTFLEYGEPILILISAGSPPPADYLLINLAMYAVMERSRNQATTWLRAAVGNRIYFDQAGVPNSQLLEELGSGGPAPLDDLQHHSIDFETNGDEMARLRPTGMLFLSFLEERFGPGALPAVLDRLGQLPEDPRRSLKSNAPDRHRATVEAFEAVTGQSWQQLNEAFQAWARQ